MKFWIYESAESRLIAIEYDYKMAGFDRILTLQPDSLVTHGSLTSASAD
jgi:hypothetical protein